MLARLNADGGRASLDGASRGNTELGTDLLLSANEKQR
jgi:hypothetical protein